MTDFSHQNLQHVLANDCHDPDCELHNPLVGIAEETVTYTDLAFYYAGAMSVVDLLEGFLGDSEHDGDDSGIDRSDLEAAIAELRDQLNLNGG